ncbi:hypothetical protein NW762_012106 [Fusarium torreyae]|uniref:Uncharacterized protein n=1 Tax=Fusarium torreyae TaxID=1237075 RepID=A0A9W8RRQ8_9HYPO|nr:hypothetical protein NW762_012106 [Fusarium torreyae]
MEYVGGIAINQTGRARQSEPTRAKTARKSRYTTLPPDVDSALRVLYGELETSAELRQRNEHLVAEVANLRRELELQKQQTQLAQRSAEASRSSHAEITQLNMKMKGMHAEIGTLQDEKKELQTELQSSQEQLKKTTETLHNLKQTLTGLIKD